MTSVVLIAIALAVCVKIARLHRFAIVCLGSCGIVLRVNTMRQRAVTVVATAAGLAAAGELAACGHNDLAMPDAQVPMIDAPADAVVVLRAPDLRFHWVGAATKYVTETYTDHADYTFFSNTGDELFLTYRRAWDRGLTRWYGYVESPLSITVTGFNPDFPDWRLTSFQTVPPTEFVDSFVANRPISALDNPNDSSDLGLQNMLAHYVVSSFDITPHAFAVVAAQVQSEPAAYSTTGFVDVPRDQLAAWVAGEASAGRVVTGLSLRSPGLGPAYK